jgi:hypothetical protein
MQTQIKPNKQRAIFLATRQLPEFICDAVNLEGINITLPEVQTLFRGNHHRRAQTERSENDRFYDKLPRPKDHRHHERITTNYSSASSFSS